jgi:polyhydroxyalkanoate synthesis regulator phasin
MAKKYNPFNSKVIDPVTSTTYSGIDLNKYTKYLASEENRYIEGDVDLERWNDDRAKAQNGFAKFGNSVGQMIGTFGTALASTVTALGSGVVALGAEAVDASLLEGDQVDGMDIFLNNPIMKGINDFDKFLKEDILPTYYTKEQQESLFSASTGTDLLNGIGFLASNILPNAAVGKLFGSWAKVVALNNVGKLTPALEALVQAGKLTTQELAIISKTAGRISKAGPMVGAVVGRLGESAIESYDTYESTKELLTAERDKAKYELDTYGITDNPKLAELTDTDIEQKAKDARGNVFRGNMILAASDLAQFTRWFKGPGIGEKLIKQGVKTIAKEVGKKDLIKGLLLESGQEAAEEGFQFLLQKGAEKQARTGQSFYSGIEESTNELFTTVEGQKSMLLGAILGGGMGSLMKFKDRAQLKLDIEKAMNQYTSLGDTKERYIKDENGKYILNPELSKVANDFMKYEEIKKKALENGNLSEYELAEKMQFGSLVLAKKSFGDYDAFIDELQSMGKMSKEEAKAYFGELPMKNGREMTPQEIISEKIKFAERIKNMAEGLDRIESINPLLPKQKNYVVSEIINQESLRDQIIENRDKISNIQSQTVLNPITNENELTESQQLEIKKLESTNTLLEQIFKEKSKKVTELISKPSKIEKEVEKQEDEKIEEILDEAEQEILNNQEKLSNIINNQEPIIIQTPEGPKETVITGFDEETGNPVDEEGNVLTPEQVIEGSKLIEESEQPEVQDEIPEDYSENSEVREGLQKPSVMSTSTRGHLYNEQGYKFTEVTGSPTGEVKFALDLSQSHIIVEMSKPENTPSDTKKYHVEVIIRELNDEQKIALLNDINKARKARGYGKQLQLSDLELNEHLPLDVIIYQNGKRFSNDRMSFHDVDYVEKTSEYQRIQNSDKLSEEEKKVKLQELKDEFLKQRTKIINALKEGKKVTIPIISKSTGVVNYNPLVKGKKQVNPLIGGKGIGVFNHFRPSGKAKGLGVVTEITDETFIVEFADNTKVEFSKYDTWVDPVLGKTFFHTIAANDTPILIDAITYSPFSEEQISSIANLVSHRLFNGNSIYKGKNRFEIVNSNKTGILNQILYLGNNKNAPEKSIYFTKAGNLRVGRNEFTSESNPEEVKQAVEIFIETYKKYSKVPIGSLDTQFILPSEISEEGEILSDEKIQPVWKFLFEGNTPLVGSNVNSDINFINSYFTYGNVQIEQSQPEQYASELSNEKKESSVTEPIKTEVNEIQTEESKEKDRTLNGRLEYSYPETIGGISSQTMLKFIEKKFKYKDSVDEEITELNKGDNKVYDILSQYFDITTKEELNFITENFSEKQARDFIDYYTNNTDFLGEEYNPNFSISTLFKDLLQYHEKIEDKAQTKIEFPETNVDSILEQKTQDCSKENTDKPITQGNNKKIFNVKNFKK